jgi:hypothetical protein
MNATDHTTEFLLDQCARYPLLRLADLLKALHQSVLGCGHFVTEDPLPLLRQELAACPPTGGPAVEPLDGAFCRAHLGPLAAQGLSPETFAGLFRLSAEGPCGDTAALEEKLAVLSALAGEGRLPFSPEEAAIHVWQEAGFPACHHSAEFRAAYAPAYRVIRQDLARLLPLLCAIDRLRSERSRVLVAVEGGSASGKTTLAALLARLYDCNVFHMDDFFLQPHQRTPERLAEIGGNVDRERFYEEVLLPLTQGETVRYRPYDCQTQAIGPAVEIAPKALNIVEGAYSMHPALADRYDLSVFLRISPELQCARIEKRNDPAARERFFHTWIPLEERYFAATDAPGRCELSLEAEP